MLELLLGIMCCLLMAGSLFAYLKITSKKYYDGKDQSSLSNTFYKTGWKFRALLIWMCLLMVYPVLLANGIYTSGGWMYYAPYTLLSWSKFAFALCIGGIIGVALNADFRKTEEKPHMISAIALAAGGGITGCMLRKEWYIGLVIWIAWILYYFWKNYKNNKAGNPNALDLYLELIAFYSVPTCLIVYMLINYFFLVK